MQNTLVSVLLALTLFSLVSSFSFYDQQFWESCPFGYDQCMGHCNSGMYDPSNNNNIQFGADWLKQQKYRCNSDCLGYYQQCMNGQQITFNQMSGSTNNYNSQNSYGNYVNP